MVIAAIVASWFILGVAVICALDLFLSRHPFVVAGLVAFWPMALLVRALCEMEEDGW